MKGANKVKNILALRMLKANGWWDEYRTHQGRRWRACALEFRAANSRTKLAVA